MFKVVILYPMPKDPAEFDRRYDGEHLEIAAQIPNLRKLVAGRVKRVATGSADYYRYAELHFDDEATMAAALASEAGQRSRNHANELSTGGMPVRLIVEIAESA
ncbi:MAG TPA: EthD family reductase [Candidatus Dormibacteraeota bacterium]|nr:EthD family reductase [Candidatus Dormibacteraeota bacterium]